jgi:hypothetical protein
MGFLAATLALRKAIANADRDAAAQIGQRKVGKAVASILRTEQREQRLVPIDRHELARADRPTPRRSAEGEQVDLPKEW